MSLEDQVARLATAIGMHDDIAVREIIKQRDAAIRESAQWEHDAKYYKERMSSNYAERCAVERKNAALRGVITRMKTKLRLSSAAHCSTPTPQ
jgi:hypothetical protein